MPGAQALPAREVARGGHPHVSAPVCPRRTRSRRERWGGARAGATVGGAERRALRRPSYRLGLTSQAKMLSSARGSKSTRLLAPKAF